MTLEKCTLIAPFYCSENEKIVEVAKKLRASTLRQVFVVDTANQPIGIISTTDMNNRIVAEGKDPKALKAKDIMSKPVELFKKNDDILEVYRKMKDKRRLICAVMDGKKFIGMITLGEVVKGLAEH